MATTPLKLTMTCGPYDRAQALIDGSVRPEGIELAVTVNSDDVDRQMRSARGDYDVVEFFTGAYIADMPVKKLGFSAIPIFVKKMFRHSYIYINKESGIRKPSDLNGRRVGVQTWLSSAAVWAKGALAEDHGVDLKSISWVPWLPTRIPGWTPPAWLKQEPAPAGVKPLEHLASGDIVAGITTELWAPNVHPKVDFLFRDHAQQERDYYRRTKCFPIMHTLLVRTSILEQHPWVAKSLFDAWEASKQKCYEHQNWQRIHMTSLWYRGLWEEERAAAGPDIYQWGFKKTRHEVDKMLEYLHQQGGIPRRYQPEELFWPSMLET
jgi:4,5-dihydroxyphthalate decarboxylase